MAVLSGRIARLETQQPSDPAITGRLNTILRRLDCIELEYQVMRKSMEPMAEAVETSQNFSMTLALPTCISLTASACPSSFKNMRNSLHGLCFNSGSIVNIHYPAKNLVAEMHKI